MVIVVSIMDSVFVMELNECLNDPDHDLFKKDLGLCQNFAQAHVNWLEYF